EHLLVARPSPRNVAAAPAHASQRREGDDGPLTVAQIASDRQPRLALGVGAAPLAVGLEHVALRGVDVSLLRASSDHPAELEDAREIRLAFRSATTVEKGPRQIGDGRGFGLPVARFRQARESLEAVGDTRVEVPRNLLGHRERIEGAALATHVT